MKETTFAGAIEDALSYAMERDKNILILGEDVHMLRLNLFARFGQDRVLSTPISESAFLGAAVTAAMGGLKPVVEIMLVDFMGVCIDGILNHASKVETFSGGNWQVPLVVRAACGDNRVGPNLLDVIGQYFRLRIGQGHDDRLIRHALDHILVQHTGGRQAQENIGAIDNVA